MRTRFTIVTAALLLTAGVADAQQAAPTPAGGSFDVGLRVTDMSGDAARFERYRDIGDGGFLERARLQRQGSNWFLDVEADHVGRRDQRYTGTFKVPGKLKVFLQWDQIPLFISGATRTPYNIESPGVFRLPDATQLAVETGRAQLADVAALSHQVDARSRRDIALLNLVFSATRDVDLNVSLKTARRQGTQPWQASFGFSNVVEVAAPLDTRTTDLRAGVEWVRPRGMLRVGYDGSWFDNDVSTLVWDNPLKFTDSTFAGAYAGGTAGSQGRYALWPSSNQHGITTAASVKLPAGTRLSGNITVATWNQDQPLLPFTINTAIPALPLPRSTTEGKARTVAMNYTANARPSRYLWLNARYRYYDFDNRTPPFDARKGLVVFDQVVRADGGSVSEALSSTRQNLDLDASFTPLPFTALRVGYGREQVDRAFRIFETTTDNVVRASVDASARVVTVRALVEHAVRRGSGFDEELLREVGEQPALRHLDVADRDRNRVTGLVQLTPASFLGLSASASVGKDDYTNSGFGLRDNENRAYTFTADLTPREEVAIGISYTRERYTALQRSRTASPGPQFTDATRDWSIDGADRVNTITSNLDLLKLVPRTELRLAYNMSRSRAAYVYGAPPGSTLARFVQLPTLRNDLHSGTADLRYFLSQKLAIGVMYWNDRYRVDDFALGPQTINRLDLPASLFLGSVFRPYTANSGWVRLIYSW